MVHGPHKGSHESNFYGITIMLLGECVFFVWLERIWECYAGLTKIMLPFTNSSMFRLI